MNILEKFSPLPFLVILAAPFWTIKWYSLALPLILFGFVVRYAQVRLELRHWAVVLVAMVQYPLWNMGQIYAHPYEEAQIITYASTYQMWIWQAALSVILMVYIMGERSIPRLFKLCAPWLVMGACVAAGTVYFVTGVCRIELLTPIVFTPPMMATTITLLYMGYTRLGDRQSFWLGMAMVVATLLLSTAFSGTRGIFLAQFCAYGAMMIMFMRGAWRIALAIGAAVIIGALIGYGIDKVAECSFSGRSLAMLKGKEGMIAADSSIRLRLLMWESALPAIAESPVWGLGPLKEPEITQPGFTHVHNMYLSWLIWGGVFSLLSGLIFLFNPLFGLLLRLPFTNIAFATIATSVFWGSSMVVDSFLVWPHYSYMYLAYFALALRLASEEARAEPLTP